MALDLRTSLKRKPSRNDLNPDNPELTTTQESAPQTGETSEGLSIVDTFRYNSNSSSRQELQRLFESFCSWLQPEKHSKEEIISQLVFEQFMMSGHPRDKPTLKKKWEARGRNLEKLMEDLNDDCTKPPVLVHVYMQGQEALFSEDMPLKDVIFYLKRQLSAGTPTGDNMRTPLCTGHGTSMATAQGDDFSVFADEEDGCNASSKTTQGNDTLTEQSDQIVSLVIIQDEDSPSSSEEGRVSLSNTHSSRRAEQGIPGSQEGCLEGPSEQHGPMEVRTGPLPSPDASSPEPAPTNQSSEGNSTSGGHQERSHNASKSYECEECSKVFRYSSHLIAHQRRHKNERPFVCAECHKGFFQTSDLRVHQVIHQREKPFVCSTCEKPFSHRTNLKAHERIHTGEKPYTCSLCHQSYRQSSTYHRHLRMHQRTALQNARSTPEASSALP
ncbi:zinc finger and SCAN domain-containing protein 4-like [Lepus europaeus]|uniref:zinc finger and SCAN domain-containing protein 4-like n=1 Tax=Lepus europaeus TaxID=9983 RepID=UPI002B47D3F3|nr:zinc finger and SCAN domain-containing protein 4-like [Lepus europaeus]